jgi:hypothetical protein
MAGFAAQSFMVYDGRNIRFCSFIYIISVQGRYKFIVESMRLHVSSVYLMIDLQKSVRTRELGIDI